MFEPKLQESGSNYLGWSLRKFVFCKYLDSVGMINWEIYIHMTLREFTFRFIIGSIIDGRYSLDCETVKNVVKQISNILIGVTSLGYYYYYVLSWVIKYDLWVDWHSWFELNRLVLRNVFVFVMQRFMWIICGVFVI